MQLTQFTIKHYFRSPKLSIIMQNGALGAGKPCVIHFTFRPIYSLCGLISPENVLQFSSHTRFHLPYSRFLNFDWCSRSHRVRTRRKCAVARCTASTYGTTIGRGNDNLDWSDLQMSFKVIKSGTNRKLVYDFLLVIYSVVTFVV